MELPCYFKWKQCISITVETFLEKVESLSFHKSVIFFIYTLGMDLALKIIEKLLSKYFKMNALYCNIFKFLHVFVFM
jgi:hypothetical protein